VSIGGGVIGDLGSDIEARTLVWVDREGREEPVQGVEPRAYATRRVQLSPDGSRLVTDIAGDIWVWDFSRRTLARLTSGREEDWYPIWSRDGLDIFFASGPPGNHHLARIAADGSGSTSRISIGVNTQDQFPQAVSKAGLLIFRQQRGATGPGDLYAGSIDGVKPAQPLFETPFIERNAALSPDEKWLAYDSNRSGRFEVYVRPFPDVDDMQILISSGGGAGPLWDQSGRDLYYLAADGHMMSAQVGTESGFAASVPRKMFDASGYYTVGAGPGGTYDVSPDGRRFIMVKSVPNNNEAVMSSARLVVTLHWFEELKRLVPTN
jgi:serine/threonine-protein kinase